MPLSTRSAIAITAVAAFGLPATAVAAPAAAQPSPAPPQPTCKFAPPEPGSVKFAVKPGKVREGTQPRLKYSITNVGATCLGVSAAPYGLQQSGFAGWSDLTWDVGPIPLYIRYLSPGQTITGTTAPLPSYLGAGGFYRVIPKFAPDSEDPVTSAPLDIV
ncbi:MAG: hypothetical protein Q7T55_04060 [Solirubrobacteraceae bacterium]|nr:hypothetical protein [Solirubrobacteraceae bacterium]